MSLITISETIPQPPIHLASGATAVLRGYYSQRFLDSGGEPVFAGDGRSGFYYEIACTVNDDDELVIPEFSIKTTDNGQDIQTSLFTGQLFVDSEPSTIIFGIPNGPGWIISASLGAETSWEQLDIFNQGRALLANQLYTYLTAAETAALIQSIIDADEDIGNTHGVFTAGRIPRATDTDSLEDSQISDDGVTVGIQTLNTVQLGDYGAQQNHSYIDVNDNSGEANLYAGADDQTQYAGVAARAEIGNAEVFIQTTDQTHLYGNLSITKLGDGQDEGNSTQVRIDDENQMVVQSTRNAAPVDAEINNEEACLYLDQSGNTLKIRVRYSDGTYKTGSIALV